MSLPLYSKTIKTLKHFMTKRTFAVRRTNPAQNVELFGADLFFLVKKTITDLSKKYTHVLSCEEVEDLVQDTYIKVCDKKSNYNPSGNFAGWVYRICLNCLRDRLTAKGKYTKKFFAIDEDFDDDDTIDVDHTSILEDYTFATDKETLRDEFKEHFWKCMHRLSPESRKVIELLMDETPYKDMAVALGCTEGTLRVKVHRARKDFRSCINSLPLYIKAA